MSFELPSLDQQYPIRQASDISIDPWKGLVPYLFARLTKLVDAIYHVSNEFRLFEQNYHSFSTNKKDVTFCIVPT